MSLEGLRTQIDALNWEKRQLETELRKLRESKHVEAAVIEREREFQVEIEELSKRVTEIPELEVKLHEALQEKEQLKVQLNEVRAKQTEEGEQQELESLKQELQEAKETVRVAVEREESLHEELERERQRCEDFEKESLELKEKLEKLKDVYDLQYYRAVEAEQKRAEEREKQLRETLPTLESQKMVEELEELREKLRNEQEMNQLLLKKEQLKSEELEVQVKQLIMQQKRAGGAKSVSPPLHKSLAKESSVSGVVVSKRTMSKQASIEPDQLSQVLLAQQLPPIPKFSGEDRSQGAETFRDWKEQFEMVASLAGWDERAKLVNLTARLRGQAFGFYRSCTLSQRASYESLVKELEKRFTPVELPAVQTSLFHDRKQKQGESVDDYAQDLRYLFYQAYPKAQQGSSEAEETGKSVLANQFVNGLIPELKAKITGKEGDVEQLLAYARFEEAKLHDSGSSQRNPSKQSPQPQFRPTYRFSGGHRTEGQTPTRRQQLPTFTDGQQSGTQLPQRNHSNRYRDIQCYLCRRYGHLARHCKFGSARGQQEARGPPQQQPSRNQIAKVTTDNPLPQPNLPNAVVNSDHSSSESPFFLLYGRDPRLPTEEALTQPRTRYQVDLDDYKTELTDGLTTAWNVAQDQIRKSQQRQKKYYDRSAGRTKISVGDRVFLYVPSAKTGKAHKFARPFHGPYRVLEVTSNDARIVPVHTPKAEPIFVALDRIRLCPKEIPFEVHWPPQSKSKSKGCSDPLVSSEANSTIETQQTSDSGNWSARLRKRN